MKILENLLFILLFTGVLLFIVFVNVAFALQKNEYFKLAVACLIPWFVTLIIVWFKDIKIRPYKD